MERTSDNNNKKFPSFDMLMHKYLSIGHINYSKNVSMIKPLKPMPYIWHFNVSTSLKKSRLLRFLFKMYYYK
jgi:hypothetical protein